MKAFKESSSRTCTETPILDPSDGGTYDKTSTFRTSRSDSSHSILENPRPRLKVETTTIQFVSDAPSRSDKTKTATIVDNDATVTSSKHPQWIGTARADTSKPDAHDQKLKRSWARSKARARLASTISIPTTPIHLPRRLSRFPSFFTREKRLLHYTLKRRDIVLIALIVLHVFLFIGIGILTATSPRIICRKAWLHTAVCEFFPDLLLGAPFTAAVVFFGVSEWGRREIQGRWTPFLYAVAVAFVRVMVSVMLGNLEIVIVKCPRT